jgi:hypothetical protein
MTIVNIVTVDVEAPASELWKLVRDYGKIHEYVDFIEGTTMDDVEPAVGVLRVLKLKAGNTLDETIKVWDESTMSYTFDIVNGPPFAKTILFTFRVEEDEATKTSKMVCTADVELRTFFSWILPSFLIKKKVGGKQLGICEGYKKAAETKLPVEK